MKMAEGKLWCWALLLCMAPGLLAQSRDGERTKLSTDSLFGIEYDAKVVHYELLPQSVIRKCFRGQELGRAINDRLGIFAHAHSGSADYYVVDSTLPVYNEYGWVTVLLVIGDACTVSGSDWALSSKPSSAGYADKGVTERIPSPDDPDIQVENSEMPIMRTAHEEGVMRSLARDAIQRGIAAHGSDAAFRKLACTPTMEIAGYPVLGEELRTYCRSAHPN
jgi:hypothetical protein